MIRSCLTSQILRDWVFEELPSNAQFVRFGASNTNHSANEKH